jgi:hypothetical protein
MRAWARRTTRQGSSEAYERALNRAALMLLAALRDHANPQFSSVQLEALRSRGGRAGRLRPGNDNVRPSSVHSVFTDLRQRTTAMLAVELKAARVGEEVRAEMNRILARLLDSIEDIFVAR